LEYQSTSLKTLLWARLGKEFRRASIDHHFSVTNRLHMFCYVIWEEILKAKDMFLKNAVF
jgi:hypothetical protein